MLIRMLCELTTLQIADVDSGEARGFKVGVKGEVREGVYPPSAGGPRLCPRKIFKLQMHAGEF
jgi:hypothetical protein